jgi:hypothetical protein
MSAAGRPLAPDAVGGASPVPSGARPGLGLGLHTVREFRTITEVPETEWDSLLDPDDLQATHRFVRLCERSAIEGAEYRHLLIRRDEGLVATATLCLMRVRLDLLASGLVRRLARGVRRLRPAFLELQVVFCGLPVSFGQSLLRFHLGAEVAAVLPLVREAADRFAEQRGAPVVCFKAFADAEAERLAPLQQSGYQRLPSLPSCRLPLPWRYWDEYLGGMRAGYRRQVLGTLRSARQQALTAHVVDRWHGECPRIFALYEQVMARAEFQLERLNLAFFERLSAEFADCSSAILIRRGDQTLAAAVLLHGPRLTTFLLVGIDYERSRAAPVYPLLVSETVRDAIGRGACALEMGQTSYALKQRLGATTSRRHLFVRFRGALGRPLFRSASGLLFPEVVPIPRRVFAGGG